LEVKVFVHLPIGWMEREPAARSDRHLELAQRILTAALNTRYYAPLLARAGLDRERIAALDASAPALCQLPRVEKIRFLSTPADFYNPHAPRPELPLFLSPIQPAPRTALLGSGFRSNGVARVFGPDWTQRLDSYRPEAIAAPVALLRQFAGNRRPVDNAIFALTGVVREDISDADRDLFWHAFGVPVFEQFQGFDGAVVASECEAHQGLHISPDAAIFEQDGSELLLTSLTDLEHPTIRVATGFRGYIDPACCDCGNPAPRLLRK
jgi:hypothetical protein